MQCFFGLSGFDGGCILVIGDVMRIVRLRPSPVAYEGSGVQGAKPLLQNLGQGRSRVNMAGVSAVAGKPVGMFVPAEERLSKLRGIFDEKTLKRTGVIDCGTCASRTYQDGSDDASVSFQAPTHLTPGQAETAVMSHEMEHVVNEQAYAREDGREVVGQSVQIFREICPECGVSYVSGGVTKTATVGKSNPYKDVMTGAAAGHLVDVML